MEDLAVFLSSQWKPDQTYGPARGTLDRLVETWLHRAFEYESECNDDATVSEAFGLIDDWIVTSGTRMNHS